MERVAAYTVYSESVNPTTKALIYVRLLTCGNGVLKGGGGRSRLERTRFSRFSLHVGGAQHLFRT